MTSSGNASIMFDTSALIAFFLNEKGAEEVDYWLINVEEDKVKGYISTVTISELAFIIGVKDIELMYNIFAYIEESNILIIPLTYEIAKYSGYYKLKNKNLNLSYADCQIILSSINKKIDAIITKDKIWKNLKDIKPIII